MSFLTSDDGSPGGWIHSILLAEVAHLGGFQIPGSSQEGHLLGCLNPAGTKEESEG